MFLLQPVGIRFFSSQVGHHFVAIGVIIGQRGVHRGQVQMNNFVCNLLRGETLLVPTRNPPHRYAGSGDTRLSALHAGRSNNECSDVNRRS